MIGLTHRVTMIAFDRILELHPRLVGHTCITTRLGWRRGEAHVSIDWCGGTIEYQPTELLVSSVRRVQ